jgi:low affinity Fe/Cu permease
MNNIFRKISHYTAQIVGSSYAFIMAILLILIWAFMGHYFGYSDTWQLVINTNTSILTFLMVFIIQNTQNRDARAIHLKLDELLRETKGARANFIELEELSDEELKKIQEEFEMIAQKYKKHSR